MGDVVESKTEQENLGTEAEKAAQEMTPKQATETNLKNGQDKADQEAGKQEKKFRESIKEIFEKSFGPILKIVIEGYANAFNKILEGKNTTIDRATQHELKRIENNYKTKIESAQTTEEKIKLTTEKYQEMIKKMLAQENISIKILLQTKENENRELKKFNPQTQDFDITKTIEELQTLKGEKFSEPDVEMGKIAFESKDENEILKKLQNSDLFKEYVQDGWDKFEFGFTATTEELDFKTSKAAFEKQKAYLKALNRECGNGQKVQRMDIQQKLQNLDFDIKFCDKFNEKTDISEEDFEAAKTAILKGIDDKKIQKQFEHRCKELRKIFCKTEDDNQANDDNGSEEETNDDQPSTTPTQPEAATEGENQKDKDTQPESNTYFSEKETLNEDEINEIIKLNKAYLELNITSITPEIATILAKYQCKCLKFNKLKIDQSTAEILSKAKCKELQLYNIEPNENIITALKDFQGEYMYLGIKNMTPEIAFHLCRYEVEELNLGITQINSKIAQGLSHYNGKVLQLNELESIDYESAKALSQFNGNLLELYKCKNIDEKIVKELTKFKGRIRNDAVNQYKQKNKEMIQSKNNITVSDIKKEIQIAIEGIYNDNEQERTKQRVNKIGEIINSDEEIQKYFTEYCKKVNEYNTYCQNINNNDITISGQLSIDNYINSIEFILNNIAHKINSKIPNEIKIKDSSLRCNLLIGNICPERIDILQDNEELTKNYREERNKTNL